jgi:site-specific recombinase XerD
MELSAAIAGFLTHVQVEKGLASNTQSAYRTDLAKFEDFAKKRKVALEAVNQDHLVDFLAGLYRQKLESKTVARHLVSLRNFFRYAQVQELIADDPTAHLNRRKFGGRCPAICGWKKWKSCWISLTRKRRWDYATEPCWKCYIPRVCASAN